MSIAYKRHQLSVPLELFFERGSLTPLADVLEHRRGKEGWKADDARMARVDRTQLHDRIDGLQALVRPPRALGAPG